MFDLKGYVLDRAVENRQQDARNPKEYNASTWDKIIGGIVRADVEGAVDDNTKLLQQQKIEDTFKPQFDLRGIEMPKNQSAAQLRKLIKADDEKTVKQNEKDQYYSLSAVEERRRLDQIRTDELNQRSDDLAFRRESRADEMSIRADDLAFQREQLAQQDRQYNLDLDRKARMDQERAFLALMGGGLDALGAAFA